MSSNINPLHPIAGSPTTASIRANFSAAKTEIESMKVKTNNGWKDMLSPLISSNPFGLSNGTPQPFGVDHDTDQYTFLVNDYVYIPPYHVNHDVKPNGHAHFHIHWSTDGVDTRTVKWEIHVTRALGHQQQAFGPSQVFAVEHAPLGTPWMHMVSETVEYITLPEPDELIILSLYRVSNGVSDNQDEVFGLMCDIHYEADRDCTPNKSPNFYA